MCEMSGSPINSTPVGTGKVLWHILRRNKASQICGGARLTEKFTERTAGIWLPMIFYIVGGVYMLAFWGIFDRSAFYLTALGAVSIVIAVALYSTSRWALWLGLFTFPLLFAEFLYALFTSLNLVGWNPNPQTAAFQASMIVYLLFLTLSLVLLIDKRNTLKSDRILDRLKRPAASSESSTKSG
jgi:hypothetical protein